VKILVVSSSLQPTCKIHAVYPLLEMEKRSNNLSWRFRKLKDTDLSEISWADILWFVRDCDSYAQNLAQWARILGKKVIYDLDDNLALLPVSTQIGMQALSADMRTSISQMASLADNVGVTSTVLMEDMAHLNQITMRPQYQDLSKEYFKNTLNRLLESERKSIKFSDEVTIVSPTVRPLNQEFLSKILRGLESSLMDKKINFVTFSESQLIDQDVMKYVRLIKIRPINNYRKYLLFLGTLENAVGLAYLENSRFNMSKTQAKYRDFASAGIPGVYSNIPPYSNSIEQNHTGLLVENDPDEWSNSILNLANNKILASNISKKALNDIQINYSFEKYLEHIWGIFSDLYASIDSSIKMCSWNNKTSPSLRLLSLPGDTQVSDYLDTIEKLNCHLVKHDLAFGGDDRVSSLIVVNCSDRERSYLAELDIQVVLVHLHGCNCSNLGNFRKSGGELYSLNSVSRTLMDASSRIKLSPTAKSKRSSQWRISKFIRKVKNLRPILLNRLEIFRLIHRN
jgi:hypothetical protein